MSPNLIITDACNLSCSYCFAAHARRRGAEAPNEINVAAFSRLVEQLGGDQVRFCGGEPTLHPGFCELLDAALAGDRSALVMSNGIWPATVLEHVAALPLARAARLSFLFNIQQPGCYDAPQRERLQQVLAAVLPARVSLALTIDRVPCAYGHLLELARTHGFKRVRYSIAAPDLDDPGAWTIDPERDFPRLAAVVHQLVLDATREGIAVLADCGYLPPCAYTADQLAEIVTTPSGDRALKFACDTAAVDIAADGTIWRCYGLYSVLRDRVADGSEVAQVTARWERQLRLLDNLPLFAACGGCEHRSSGLCGGGCYAYRLGRERAATPGYRLAPLDDDETLLGWAPVHAAGLCIWRRADGSTEIFLDGERPKMIAATERVLAFLAAADGETPLRQILAGWPDAARDAAAARAELLALARELFDEDAISFRR